MAPETSAGGRLHAGLRQDALATLLAWRAPDDAQERLRSAYVEHLAAADGDAPDGVLKQPAPDHLTASVAVLSADRTHVLLTLHRKARAWFQLGGHLEAGDRTLAAAALREAGEESGSTDLRLSAGPVRLDLHPVPFCHTDGRARHLDVQYAALAPAGAQVRVSEESIDLRWWPVDALPTQEESLHRLVARAVASLERVDG